MKAVKLQAVFLALSLAVLIAACGQTGTGGTAGPGVANAGGPSDKPTVPGNLKATANGSTQIDLTWNSSTDDKGVSKYKVYRNGALINTMTAASLKPAAFVSAAASATQSFSDKNLNSGTNYCYQVSAVDTDNNESAKSSESCATTSGTGGTGTGTFTASGTYAVNTSTDEFTLTVSNTDFPANGCGPDSAGSQTFSITNSTSTIMTWVDPAKPGEEMTWTKQGGGSPSPVKNVITLSNLYGNWYIQDPNSNEYFLMLNPDGSWTLTANVVASCGGGSVDYDDFGNDFMSAYSIFPSPGSPSMLGANIDYPGDYDYFALSLPSGGTLTVYTTGPTNTYGTLYNGMYGPLMSDDNTQDGMNFKIVYTIPASGTYYLTVDAYNTGMYTLNVMFTQGGGGSSTQKTAGGTYTFDGTNLVWNWTSSTFDISCPGPGIGPEMYTATVGASSMLIEGYWTWTRPSGTAGNIVGSWSDDDQTMHPGVTYSMTYEANGNLSLIGSCTMLP